MNIKAIETEYKGYRFRSRLEARWAVFFDALGVKWEYEKEGYEFGGGERYLPDFWLPDHRMWIEVKGQQPTEEERLKLVYLQDATGCPAFVFMQIPHAVNDHSYYEAPFYEDVNSHWSEVVAIEGKPPFIAKRDEDSDFSVANPYNRFETATYNDYQVLCPVCGEEYVHFNEPDLRESDDYTAWEGRGSALRIPMWCESGHSWTLRFGFHKGNTFMAIEDVSATEDNPGMFLAGCDRERLARAFAAATSARFEHGEKPRMRA